MSIKIPSIFSAIKKLNAMLAADDRRKIAIIAMLALGTSLLEAVTASSIAVFAQVLNDPSIGMNYLDRLGIDGADNPADVLMLFAGLCGGVYLVKNIYAAFEIYRQNSSIQSMCYDFKNRLLGKYAFADYAEYLMRNSSYSSRVVGGDAELVFSNAMVALAIIASETIVFAGLIAFIIYLNPSLALLIFGLGAVIALLTAKFVLPAFYRWGKKAQDAGLMSWQTVLEFFHGFKEIILLGKRDEFIGYYRRHSRDLAATRTKQATASMMPRLVIEVVFIGMFVVAICFLAASNQLAATMMATLGGYMYAGFRLMPGLNRIINQLNMFKSVIPSIDRVYEEYTQVQTPENYQDMPDLAFASYIDVKHVSYRFPASERDILSDVSFQIYKGERIGIVGETGAGKSTLVDILLGLLKPKEGTVLVDGKYSVMSQQWHNRIGYVAQSIYLIDNTIRANIAFGVPDSEIDEVRLNNVIHAAQLTTLINNLPQKEMTEVGERGVRLSGGERQRVAIARALYHQPEILVFDEATSALDHETESRLMDTMYEVSDNKTMIMIAHRLSTLDRCDRIIRLENGRVIAIEVNEASSRRMAQS